MRGLRNKIILSVVFGLAVLAALAIYADVREIGRVLQDFEWALIPLILGLTLFNYVLRFVKWHLYLRLVDVRLGVRRSAEIFVSGFAMAMTPGKVGELFKSYLLKEDTGVPMARTAPIVMAERLTDGMAMVLLAATGLAVYPEGRPLVAAIIAAMIALIVTIQFRRLSLRLIAAGEQLPLLKRFAGALQALYESSYRLLNWRWLAMAVGIGLVSWSGEGVAFYLVLRGLGLPASTELLLKAIFILSFSTLIGAVTFLPGGLLAIEVSLTGLLVLLLPSISKTTASAATVLIRMGTLWFGVSLGLVVLLLSQGSTVLQDAAVDGQPPAELPGAAKRGAGGVGG